MARARNEAGRLYPMLFKPVYKDMIWGGSRLRDCLGRAEAPERCAESWEIADRPDGMSVVGNGPLSGQPHGALVAAHGEALLGPGAGAGPFPLLCKIIDARERLSLQVHPGEAAAGRLGGEPKTEMWVVLDAAPDACIHAGFKPGLTPEMLESALREGASEDALVSIPVRAGDAILIPAGRPHSIGAGCLIFEVQQNSNTTYRIFDWNRVGPDGKPRALHLEQAMASIDWSDSGRAALAAPRLLRDGARTGNRIWELVASPFFAVERMEMNVSAAFKMERRGFQILFVEQGRLAIEANGVSAEAARGATVLVPACAPEYKLSVKEKPCRVLRVTRPGAQRRL